MLVLLQGSHCLWYIKAHNAGSNPGLILFVISRTVLLALPRGPELICLYYMKTLILYYY